MGPQLRQLRTLPAKLTEQRGHGDMQLLHLEAIGPVLPSGRAHPFDIEKWRLVHCAASGKCEFEHVLSA
jgi:hypothetical protein